MKVKYLVSMAGSYFVRNVGDIGTLPDAEAERMLAAGYVERIDDGDSGDQRPAVPSELSEPAPPPVANKSGRGRK